MIDILLYLSITILGYLVGGKARKYGDKLNWISNVQTFAIFCLVLIMGMRMGANDEITSHLSSIGISALIMTVFAIVFSIIAMFILRKILKIDRYGRLKNESNSHLEDMANDMAKKQEENSEANDRKGFSLMTIVIVLAILVGMSLGYFAIREIFAENLVKFDEIASLGIKLGLCTLLFFVGMDLGIDGTIKDNFGKLGGKVLLFPIITIIGSLVGTALAGILLNISLRESLAIGGGMGWYSLAPGIIMDAGYITASAIAFLHNVLRELLSIIFVPLVAEKVGYLETTAMPGAPAMDVCLPIIERSTRSDIAVYSFISGLVIAIAVPIIVPIFVG